MSKLESALSSRVMFSMKAGIAEISQLPDRQVKVTCLPTKGILMLRNRTKKNDEYFYASSDYTMEMAWESEEPNSPKIIIPLRYGLNIQLYDKENNIMIVRTRPFSSDNHPYFFWSQEANKDMIDTCISYIMGEISRIHPNAFEEASGYCTLSLYEYIQQNKILEFAEHNDEVIERLLPYLPEACRTKEKFIQLLHDDIFRNVFMRSINLISDRMNTYGCSDFNESYELNLEKEENGNVRSYLNNIYRNILSENQLNTKEKDNDSNATSKE